MKVQGLNVRLNAGQVSDLFFNMGHDGWTMLHEKHARSAFGPDPDMLRATITTDAKDFFNMLGIVASSAEVEALVNDFFDRV